VTSKNINVDFDDLSKELQILAKTAKTSFDNSIKAFSAELVSKLFDNSPVDTGLYRSNHTVSIGSLVDQEQPINDKSTVVYNARMDAKSYDSSRDSVVYIQNNVDYAEKLEFGHSQQTPAGIYGQTLSASTFKFLFKD